MRYSLEPHYRYVKGQGFMSFARNIEERQVHAGPPVVRDNAPTGATLAINDYTYQ